MVTDRIDVASEVVVARPRPVVADFAVDPASVTRWYARIRDVRHLTPAPLEVGSRLAFVAHFLGRTLEYTYEVVEWVPHERFVMRTADGPFPMETTYTWADAAPGATRMTLRNRGRPEGLSRVATPLLARAVARSTAQDLRRLRAVLEAAG
ncbi:SRPBCC family protein [Aquipuribacter nitratireducens]|uniref:SRPBCC family protein n=1 Tax=Aquipuribacter nitratireducens TaxID=650104 RepID=A0ABW0GNW5_9MICO